MTLLTEKGVSNIPFPPNSRKEDPFGRNSFYWASTKDCPGVDTHVLDFLGIKCLSGSVGTHNNWSWQNARDYEWQGLVSQNPTDRHRALTNMFRAVGQVMHLLEDASQPQHVRNEQHIDKWPCTSASTPWRSPIERYGDSNVKTLNYQHGMLKWRDAGFKELEDFWSRHLYNGNKSALATDANSGAKLGLAEFSNGNFLGARHLYPEYFKPDSVAYYPFPSRDSSTTYGQVKANPISGLDTFTLKNGYQGKGIYLEKNRDGITVKHHSRVNYLGAKKIAGLEAKAFCTIADPNVLADYHSILITNAVYYSAGLLDYFFRGKLETITTPNTGAGGTLQLAIKNVSGQDLRGGTFRFFWDDESGTRTELTSTSANGYFGLTWSSSSSLANNGTVNATFTPPDGVTIAKYTLVYRGIIGNSGTAPLDPVERDSTGQDLAIAAKALNFLWWKIDEAGDYDNRMDSVQGVVVETVHAHSGVVHSVSGKISTAVEFVCAAPDADARLATDGGGVLFYDGKGLTQVGWFRHNGFSGNVQMDLGMDGDNDFYGVSGNPSISGLILGNSTPVPIPSAGTWHFFVLEYDPVTENLTLEFDRNGTVYTDSFGPVDESGVTLFARAMVSGGSSLTWALDEVGIFPFVLTENQKDFLYHSGDGRTYPFTLPQAAGQ